MKNELPKVTNRKKINIKKFEALAKRVRKYFKEEAEYLDKMKKYEDNNSTRTYLDIR